MNNDILKFMINQKPFYATDPEFYNTNIEYLKNLNPKYFKDVVDNYNIDNLNINDSINIRITYFHAIETFFSLLFAVLQAPYYVIGWLQFYKIKDIKNLISILNNNKNFKYFKFNLEKINWNSLSKLVNRINLPDNELEPIYTGFSKFWEYLADEYLDDKFQSEYNQIKHGFRANYSGFSLKIKNEKNMEFNFNGSDFGSSYSIVEKNKITNENVTLFHLKQNFKNWNISSMRLIIELLSFSINNIRSFALIVNNISGKDVIFEIPDKIDDFNKAVKNDIGVLDSSINIQIKELNECLLQEIEELYETKIYFKEDNK